MFVGLLIQVNFCGALTEVEADGRSIHPLPVEYDIAENWPHEHAVAVVVSDPNSRVPGVSVFAVEGALQEPAITA